MRRRAGVFYPVRNNAQLLPPGQRPSGAEPGPAAAAGLGFRIIPAGFNAPPVESLWVATTGISNGVYYRCPIEAIFDP